MAGSSSSSIGVGDCWCGMEVKLFTSKTQENPGRPFFRCINGSDSSKGHVFKWVEDVLLEELGNAKSEIEMMKKVIEDVAEDNKAKKKFAVMSVCVCVAVLVYVVRKN